MKTVSKEEFDKFINEYPGKLTSGCTTICEPPFRSFRDESLPSNSKPGSADFYFDKEVARISMNWLGPNGEIDRKNTGEFWEYKIKKTNTELSGRSMSAE